MRQANGEITFIRPDGSRLPDAPPPPEWPMDTPPLTSTIARGALVCEGPCADAGRHISERVLIPGRGAGGHGRAGRAVRARVTTDSMAASQTACSELRSA